LDGVDFVYVLSSQAGPDEYVHLAGRTGRNGKKGNAVSIVSYTEARALSGWANLVGFQLTRVPDIEGE
jgi:superfamily II DNA/RNA helicase